MTTAKPAAETIRSAGWIAAAVAVLGTLALAYFPLLRYSFNEWLKPDYSHGFLVPVFAVFLAWHWRAWAPEEIAWPDPWGLAFVAGGVVLYLVAGLTNWSKEWLQGLSLVLNLCGAAVLLGGVPTLRWLWPALAFLLFMFPLPYRVEHALGWPLQRIAAAGSEFLLQSVGYPTYRDGVIIHVKDHTLEVEKACNGLSMLLTFLAMSAGMAMVVRRPWLDRVLILLAAVPIAIVANIIRIALTGILYNEAGKELGDRVFHDLAGWLMMLFALGILWAGLKVLDWVLVEDPGQATREDIIKASIQPVHLFMTSFDPAGTKAKPAEAKAKPGQPGPKPGGAGR